MTSARRFPKPTTVVRTGGATLRFYHSDSLDLLPKLEPGSVDAIVTSPPYNLGVQYRSYHDALPGDRYLAWTKDWIALAARVLADNGSLFLNVGNTPTQPWTAFDVVAQARHTLRLQNTIHWIKSIVIDQDMAGARAGLERDLAVGHYKPVNSKRFVNDCHEFIFHLTPSGRTPLDRNAIGVPYQDQSNVGRWRNGAGGIRCRGNAWFIPYVTIQNRARDRPHPATFPPKLPERCLQLHGARPGALIIDPFTGLGSTAVACAALGLDFIGIEIDRGYLDEAVQRVRDTLARVSGKRPRKTSGA